LDYRQVKGKLVLEPLWATFWFRATGEIPEEWREREVDLLFHGSSEALLWIRGQPVQGMNKEGALPGEEGSRLDALLPSEMVRLGRVEAEV
jgi:hypothetical protein